MPPAEDMLPSSMGPGSTVPLGVPGIEGSAPHWSVPGPRKVLPPGFPGPLSGGLGSFMASAGHPPDWTLGGRRHFSERETTYQREPQMLGATSIGYYQKRPRGSEFRRHVHYAAPPSGPVWREPVVKIPPQPSCIREPWDEGKRQFPEISQRTSGHFKEPSIPRLKRHGRMTAVAQNPVEMAFSKHLGIKIKSGPGDFIGTGRAGDTSFNMYSTGPRVEEQLSIGGERYYARHVDPPTYRRFVAALETAPKVPFMERRAQMRKRAKQIEKDQDSKLVAALDSWEAKLPSPDEE